MASEKRKTDSNRIGRPFRKVQVSKVYQYIEDKIVEVVVNLRIYINVQQTKIYIRLDDQRNILTVLNT